MSTIWIFVVICSLPIAYLLGRAFARQLTLLLYLNSKERLIKRVAFDLAFKIINSETHSIKDYFKFWVMSELTLDHPKLEDAAYRIFLAHYDKELRRLTTSGEK